MKKQILYIIVVVLGVVLGTLLGLHIVKMKEKTIKSGGILLKGYVNIVVYDKYGRVRENMTTPLHSPTNNFAILLAVIFEPHQGDVHAAYSVTDVGGTSRIICTSYDLSYSWDDITDTPRWYIYIGNASSPTFSRDKYNLESVVAKLRTTDPGYYVSSDKIVLVINSEAWTADKDYTITEVGLVLKFEICDSTDNNYAYALMFYDILPTPITVKAGETIVVSYKLVLP